MLPFSPSEALLACPLSPPYNLPSLWSPLSSPSSRSDPSFAEVRLSLIFTPFHLTICCSGQSALFLFFGKGGSGVLANCSLCGTEATISFSADRVCSSFSAEICAILQALCWSRQHQQAISLLSDSLCPHYCVFLLRLSFYLNFSGRKCLLSPHVLLDYNGSPDIRFSRGTTRLMSWPDGERYSCPLRSCVASRLSLLFTLVFSRTGGVLSHRNSLTHRFPQFPPRHLCSLVTLAVFSLV